MQEESKPAVSRRGLLRRAGTVAAGVGAAGAAGAFVANPAQATNGEALTHGGTFNGPAPKTTITGGDEGSPALKLANHVAGGAPLELKPTVLNPNGTSPVALTNPVGTTYVDTWGDVHVIGAPANGTGDHFDNMLYSPTWATMTIPTPPLRVLHTWSGYAGGTELIVPGSWTPHDSLGRVRPRPPVNGVFGPDMVIDLSSFITKGFSAVQANLTIGNALDTGWAALWPSYVDDNDPDEWPGNSSINYTKDTYIANFTQTVIGDYGWISLRLTSPAIVIVDICGFVVTDPGAQFGPGPGGSGAAAKGFSALKESLTARRNVTPRR